MNLIYSSLPRRISSTSGNAETGHGCANATNSSASEGYLTKHNRPRWSNSKADVLLCSCVEPDDSQTVRRFRDYSNYNRLTSDEEAQLLALCLTLSPDKMIGTIFHPSNDCDGANAFLELSAVRTDMIMTNSLVVGGQRRNIQKIMLFKEVWMERNYIEPLRSIARSGRRPPPPRRSNSSCTIM